MHARFPRLRWFHLLAILSGSTALADVKLPALFTDHMVLQQKATVPVWGWADEGETVVVEFRGKKVSTEARDGKWMVKLKNLRPGAPDTLKVTGKNAIIVNDVLVGEVWVASGQSNMEWPLRSTANAPQAIDASANPHIRLFTVPKLKANEPQKDVKAAWQACNPQTVAGFSAVAYYFARDLEKARGVPIGIIHTSWGGSPAEVWMSEDLLAGNPAYNRDILNSYTSARQKFEQSLASFESEKVAAAKEGRTFNKRAPGAPWKPSELYNGMIAPLVPYAIRGAIWYQGESNASRAHQYRTLFADLIRNWRKAWGQGDFSFIAVQLAPWDKSKKRPLEEITSKAGDSDWAELREAQVHATRVLPKVGVIVTTDVGDKDDIHPIKKEPVGARLALAARKLAYGERIVAFGPTYKKVQFKDGQAVLSFENGGGGLEAKGGDLTGFAIAGEDQKFVWAAAGIDGTKVRVWHADIKNPAAVRYGWSDFPVVNLFNKEGLPASPFRTDDFPLTTAPKP